MCSDITAEHFVKTNLDLRMYNVHVVLRVDPAETKGMKKSKGIR